ncbi:helix-turn-helix transcriptional regulator [Streptomyces sp. M19]
MRSEGETIGDRIGRLRERHKLTQSELAERADVSVDVVRRLEQNVRLSARLSTLNQLSRALDVETSVLVGQPTTFEARTDGTAPSVLALRQAVSPVSDLIGDGPDPEDPGGGCPACGAALDRGSAACGEDGRDRHRSAAAHQRRPRRRASAHGSDRAASYAVLAEAYQIAATTFTALGKEDAAFTAMERATEAARHSDDPRLEAVGASTLAWIFTKQGRLEDAEHVALTYADRIARVPLAARRAVSVGILLLRAATAAVRQGERKYDTVNDLLRQAKGAAETIGVDRMDYATPFGPTNASVAKVNFLVEMEKNREAVTERAR